MRQLGLRASQFTSARQSWKRIIRKHEWAKHLDELKWECEGSRLQTVAFHLEREGGMKQRLSLRRRAPCKTSSVVGSATTKIPKLSLRETLHESITADAVAFTRVRRTSGAMRRMNVEAES
jgi:hypothetical protein